MVNVMEVELGRVSDLLMSFERKLGVQDDIQTPDLQGMEDSGLSTNKETF